jgi:hypothetical protein
MSYTTLDQFETEPNGFYSGSYTDGIYMGNLGDSRGRFLVAARSSGSNELRYAQHYSDFVDYSGSNRNRSLGDGLRFRTFVSANELYQDTILPDIYNAFLLNGGVPVIAHTEASLSPIMLTKALPGIPGSYPVGKLVFATYGTTASYNSGSVNIADRVWFATFPFQGRYRDIVKNVTAQFFRTNIACPATESQLASFDGIPRYGPNDSYGSSSLATAEIIIPRTWIYGTVSGPSNNEPIRYTLMDVTGAVNSSGSYDELFFGNNSLSAPFPPFSTGFYGVGSGTKKPQNKQLIRFVFGFGDNYQGIPIINAVTSSKLNNTIGVMNGFYASSVDIRGWRYGVVNGFPYYSSCIFRSNRYGQFRDMMEQRKISKFFDPNGIALDGRNNARKGSSSAAVQVVFVSGSNSFVTASFPTSLNLNDSGLFDFECKSGQPWHDV